MEEKLLAKPVAVVVMAAAVVLVMQLQDLYPEIDQGSLNCKRLLRLQQAERRECMVEEGSVHVELNDPINQEIMYSYLSEEVVELVVEGE